MKKIIRALRKLFRKKRKIFEYEILYDVEYDLEYYLRSRGADGWEVISIREDKVIFKRVIFIK